MADVNYLPEDLLIRILLYLPVESLVRFRCVSKHWFDLITSPEFVRMHHNCDKRDEIILIKRSIKGSEETSLPLHANKLLDPKLQNLEIPGLDFAVPDSIVQSSCNGLICVSPDHENYYIFNPALRELKQIPTRPSDASKPFTGRVGFGFDGITNHYKVLILAKLDDDKINIPLRCFQVRIYNLITDSWKETEDEIPSLIDGPCSQVLFNGCCHWVANLHSHMFILSFDFSTEAFGVVELSDPILSQNNGESTNLSVFNQCLSLIQEAGYISNYRWTDLWVMEKYGVKESWVKYFSIQPQIERPLSIWNDVLLVQGSCGRLVSLPLGNKEAGASAFPIFAEDYTMEIVNYRESLVSFK